MASDDPEFKSKAADILGLYLYPPQHAAVFCVDDKNRHSSLGSSRSRPGAFAGRPPNVTASSTTDTEHRALLVCGAQYRHPVAFTASSSRSFAKSCIMTLPRRGFTSSSTISPPTKLKRSAEFRQQHPRVRFHLPPAGSSWLNQVGNLVRQDRDVEVIARGMPTSVSVLLANFARATSAPTTAPTLVPVRSRYSDPPAASAIAELTATGH